MASEQPLLQCRCGEYVQMAETTTAQCDDMTAAAERSFDSPPAQFSASKTGLWSIFSRSKSHRAGAVAGVRAEYPALSQQSPNQLAIPHEDFLRPWSLSSASRVITTSTLDSGRPFTKRTSWDPPPLFQAYPQALKFATLDASSLPVESILHMNGCRESAGAESATPAESHDIANTKKKARRQPSVSISCGQWTRKLYLLVTSGYLLQYAAEGHYDRLPEKILELCSQSVAFASDAIPGKHWVLQVSHDPKSNDETLGVAAKTVWSRFAFRAASQKKMAKSFLLICESPEDLDSWLSSVRTEIEALGGANHSTDTTRADQNRPFLEHKLSQRFQIQRDPHQFSQGIATGTEHPGREEAFSFTPFRKYEPLPEIETQSVLCIDQPFARIRGSLAGSSLVTTTDLDGLRDSSQSNTTTATAPRTSADGSASSVLPANHRPPVASAQLNTRTTTIAPLVQVQPSPNTIQGLALQAAMLSPEQFPSLLDSSTGEGADQILDTRPEKQGPMPDAPNFNLPTSSQILSRASLIMSETSSRSSFVSTELALIAGNTKFPTKETNTSVDIEEKRPQRLRSSIAPHLSRDAVIKQTRNRVQSAEYVVPRIPAKHPDSAAIETGTLNQRTTVKKYNPPPPTASFKQSTRRHSSIDYSRFTAPSPPPESVPAKHPGTKSNQRPSSTAFNDPTSMRGPPAPKNPRQPRSVQIEVIKYVDSRKPERSPQVTAAHLATNFGTALPSKRSSSARVSATSTGKPSTDKPSTARVTFQMRPTHITRTLPRRLVSGAGLGIAIGPPAGPPPSWPLPAVPVRPRTKGPKPGYVSPPRVYLDLTTSEWE